MKVFVVQVIPEGHLGRVSQEGYSSLTKAQAFIEGRADRPQKITEYMYRTADYTDYLIYEIEVK